MRNFTSGVGNLTDYEIVMKLTNYRNDKIGIKVTERIHRQLDDVQTTMAKK